MSDLSNINWKGLFTSNYDDKQWISKHIIGGHMIFFSFLIIPLFIITGYIIEHVRKRLYDERTPLPEWSNWKDYLREGFRYHIGFVKYYLVVLIPILILVILMAIVSLFLPNDATFSNDIPIDVLFLPFVTIVLYLTQFLLWILGMGIMYMQPYFILSYLSNDSCKDFYNFRKMWNFIKEVFILFIILISIMFSTFQFQTLFLLFPVIGWSALFALIMIFSNFYVVFYNKSRTLR